MTGPEPTPPGFLRSIVAAQARITAAGVREDAVARTAAEQTYALLGHSTVVSLADDRYFHVVASAGTDVRSLDGCWYQRAGSFSESCLQAGATAVSRDLLDSPPIPDVPPGLGVRSAVATPLIAAGTPAGVLLVMSPEPDAFALTSEVLDVVTALGLAVSAALTAGATQTDLDSERLHLTAASTLTGTGLWRWDARAEHLQWSPEMYAIAGLDPAMTPTLTMWESRLHPDDRAQGSLARDRPDGDGQATQSLRLRDAAGGWRELVSWSRTLREDGEVTVVFGAVVDVTSQRTAEREVARMAARDGLTGLANRRVVNDLTRRAIVSLPRDTPDEPFDDAPVDADLGVTPVTALLLLDLDRFKLVNDTLGHAVGDALLVEIARRLRHTLELPLVSDCSPTVARLGGDEFVILLPWMASAEAACDIATGVVEEVRKPIDVPGSSSIVCTGSIGVAVTSDTTHSAGELFREADLAMYRAKEAGRDRMALFDKQMQAQAESRLLAERRLRAAIEHDRLVTAYQPIVSLADGRVTSVEALIRITDDAGGVLLPEGFIAVAEDTGLIVELDRQMIRQAVQRLTTWRADGVAGVDVQVNVSARTLSQPGFDDGILDLLAEHGLRPSELRLEITETSLVPGGSTAQDTLVRLAAAGIQAGVDDFGTGYSALAYLQDLPVSFIKVDRTFVGRLNGSTRASAVVRAVIELAHAHGYPVTAEGVETPLQADLLRDMGCDFAQGWLFGRPTVKPGLETFIGG
ncbi:MAG: putative bifunctional diguanylate cyclase/phosphodiesterase [Angustibacter sp.]